MKTHQKLWAALGVALFFWNCSDEATDTLAPTVELGAFTQITDLNGNQYEVGYDQVSSNNQDSYVLKKDVAGNELWRLVHGSSPVDERAYLVNIDPSGNPWVVFSVDGGSNSSQYISNKLIENGAFSNVFLSGYGRASGAAKVSILAQLNPETGNIVKGTFLMARTEEGNINANPKTNTFVVNKIGFSEEGVIVECDSYFKPPAVDATESNFLHHPDATEENKQGDKWVVRLQLPYSLSRLISSEIIP